MFGTLDVLFGHKSEKGGFGYAISLLAKIVSKRTTGHRVPHNERKVPQRSDASQNDHKSKGHPSKTSEVAFTMPKSDKIDLNRLALNRLK